MEKATRRRYTLEYKQEAVRLLRSGQRVSAAAKSLGIVEQTLANWVKADKAGQLRGVTSEQVSAERMENIRLRADLALDRAWHSRSPVPGLRFHSDGGSQYASRCYTDRLAGRGIKASMSRRGNCWDNACSETLFESLKVERLHARNLHTRRQAKDNTLEWMLWYNRSRRHSTLGYLSPAQFEKTSDYQQHTALPA